MVMIDDSLEMFLTQTCEIVKFERRPELDKTGRPIYDEVPVVTLDCLVDQIRYRDFNIWSENAGQAIEGENKAVIYTKGTTKHITRDMKIKVANPDIEGAPSDYYNIIGAPTYVRDFTEPNNPIHHLEIQVERRIDA